jgi:hypothetical protein
LKKSGIDTQANFTHLRELLEEEQIQISYTIRSGMLKEAGITSAETRRNVGERRTMRERRVTWGELVQTDASPCDWFGLGIQYAVSGFKEEATGDIPGWYLCEYECLQGYFQAFRVVLPG